MLLLVDGSSYLYRAFHALPDLRDRSGRPTGAVYGVLGMLRRLSEDFPQAERRAVVFDAKGPTFREKWYPAYKAQRPPMPDDLVAQIAPLHDCIDALGWPRLCIAGVEADDVIGTLAVHARARGEDCLIVTGDKDFAQLVDDHITLLDTMKNERLDLASVEAKFGVPPARIVDYLALIGDSVDNVPGVAKVGPKTAVKWLNQYGSLEAIIAAASEIKGVVGENLRRHLDFLPLGRKLLTIVCDLDLPAVDLHPRPPDTARLSELFAALDFRSWLRELSGAVPDTKVPSDDSSGAVRAGGRKVSLVGTPLPVATMASSEPDRSGYECLLDWAAFDIWLARLQQAERVALDTETSALDPLAARMVGLSFALREGEKVRAAYLPLGHDYAGAPAQLPLEAVLERLKPWLEDARPTKIGQHLKYDRHVLANHGIRLAGILDDTLLQSYVLEADKGHDLGQLAERHLGWKTISYDEVTGKGAARIPFSQVAIEQATAYAAEDADITLRIAEVLNEKLAHEARLDALYREIELPLAEVLFRIERQGVTIDSALLQHLSSEMGRRLLELEQEAHRLAGQPFNLASPKQLADILFVQQGIKPVKKTPSGTPSTDEEVLEKLAEDYPLPRCLLEHRQLAKLKGTYTDKLPKMLAQDGRLHTHFAQAVAVTGRLSSSEPNLQNIPIRTPEGRRIRTAFIAPPGCLLLAADYSQIELRIMAHLSHDSRLLEAFSAGEDIHRVTAGEIFGLPPGEVSLEQRRAAKAINFGLIYGMSAFGLARQLGLERSAAQSYLERYFARYPGVARYMEEARATARRQGYVETLFGRRLYLPEIQAAQAVRRQAAERAAINAPMQGTAADIVKKAMLAVQGWLDEQRLQSRMILQVHDELVLEVPQQELDIVRAALPGLMTDVAQLAVPLIVDLGVGPNWESAH